MLKAWEKEASDYLKASATEADGKIKDYDEEKWRRTTFALSYVARARQIEFAKGETAEVKKLRAWSQQVVDRVNFDVTEDGIPIPRTEEGKRQAEALKQQVERLKGIASMSLNQRIEAAMLRALTATDAQGNNKLAGELRDAVLKLVEPESLAIMAGVLGVVGLSTLTPAGPFVIGAVGIFGYIMTGKTVIDVGYDGYMFITIAAGARREEDIDKAADHFISAAKTLATEGAGAVLGVGAAKVGKGLSKLKGVAGKTDDAKNMAVRRGDGKVQINDGSPPPSAGGADAAAHAVTHPVPPVRPLTGKPRFTARPAPAGLSEAAQAVWKSLDEALGKDVMDPFAEWATKGGGNLEEALTKLKSVIVKTLANTHQPHEARRLTIVEDLISESTARVHLKDIFDNPVLRDSTKFPGLTLQRLLDDLDKVADTEGYISAFKRLSNKKPDGSVLKGVLAEIQLAAKDGAQGLNIPFNSPIDGKKIKLSDGRTVTIRKGTDADVVSRGYLWQVKTGYLSLDHAKLEGWLRQAAEAIKSGRPPGGATKVGLKVDAEAAGRLGVDANGNFVEDTFYKTMFETLKKKYGDIFKIEPFTFPNP